MKPSVFHDPELPKALLRPRYRRRVKEIKPLIAPRRVVTAYCERAERRKGNRDIFRPAVSTTGVFREWRCGSVNR